MNILFTGASSFTGSWFAQELASAGHHVVVPFRRKITAYSELRGQRVAMVANKCKPIEVCDFGSETFISMLEEGAGFDILCHHAACVEGYRSEDFDVARAFSENTRNGKRVLECFKTRGGKGVVITGSVFEANEGAGSQPLRAFSPYGLSKSISAEFYEYWCKILKIPLGKFVIPNPFGPYEEPRFCSYLMRTWANRETPSVNTPDYVRDNIHISLLAKIYASFVEKISGQCDFIKCNPSGYIEAQGIFAARFARELESRLGVRCPLKFSVQKDFSEPLIRINFDTPDYSVLAWQESMAWDQLASYYEKTYLKSQHRA